MQSSELYAVRLRNGVYAIRPKGCIGMCGWINGVPWTVRFVKRLPSGVIVET